MHKMTENNHICKLCQSSNLTLKFSKSLLGGKINADYFECLECGLLQSYHLDNISPNIFFDLYNVTDDLDTGATWRQYVVATRIQELVNFKLIDKNKNLKVLEFGCGSGYLIHLLHHLYGWNVIGYDPYTKPYYSARQVFTEWKNIVDQAPFDLIIATEVFEHFINPRDEIIRLGDILNKKKSNVYLTTGLYISNQINSSWNYLAPQSGQHVSFYSRKAHQYIVSWLGGSQLLNVGKNYEWLYCIDEKHKVRFQSFLKAFIISALVKLRLFPKIE